MTAVPSRSDQGLAVVSFAQLLCGLAGMIVAIRRGHAFDVPLARGSPEALARHSLVVGTALSAPATMMTAQAALTVVVTRGASERAARGLAALGGAMTAGYLAERLVRHRLRPSGWEPVETPVVALGLGLSVAMALIGSRR